MQEAREKQKEEEVLALKRSMEGGMVSSFFEIFAVSFAINLVTGTSLTLIV